MKVVIVGSGGRLGAALAREWRALGNEVVGFNHATLDLASDADLRTTLGSLEFDVLVNCAALTNVDYCETHIEEAYRINAEAIRTIGEICAEKRRRCIHISTDYVFDGEKRSPYLETDVAAPLGVYAASKLAGETALLETSPAHLVARVSWVFGPDRPSFVDQILKRATETEDLSAIDDKWSAPAYTLDLSEWLRPLLREVSIGGVIHLCNSGVCTWREYGQYALDAAGRLGVSLKGRKVAPLKMSDLKAFVARRPVYTVLSTQRLTDVTGVVPRSWESAVEDHVRQMLVAA